MAKKDTEITEVEPLEEDQEILEEAEEASKEDTLDHDAVAEDEYVEEHEDEHISLSSRILRVLAILAIGAAGALWAGPKVAPLLPAGLKPVADFLSPQTDVSTQIAALQADFDSRIAKIEADNADQDAVKQIKTALDQLAIKDTELGASLGAVSETTETLEASIADLQAELTKINARQALTSQNGSISENALQEFEDKLSAITAAQQNLSKSQTMAVEAQQDAEGKLRLAKATSALSEISDALETGASFQKPLSILTSEAGITAPAELEGIAVSGTTALSDLKKQLPELARIALRTDAAAVSDDNTLAKFTSFLKSQVGTRSLEPQQGDDLDAVLSRIEAALDAGNLDASLNETNKLTDSAKNIMGDWIASLSQLNNAKKAVQTLQQHLTTLK